MKKVLYLISSLKVNGPNNVLLNMLKGIDKKDYEVYVVSFLNNNDLKYVEEIKKITDKIYLFNFNKKIKIITNGPRELKKIVKIIKPDIIHSHGVLPDIANAKLKFPAKKITTIHDNMFEDYIYSFGKFKGTIYINMHLRYLKRFDKCVCCSSSSHNILKKHLKNTTYIRNSIFEKPTDSIIYNKYRNMIRKKYSIKSTDIVYLYAGNLTKLKRVIEMVDFFNNNLKDYEYLFILGKGPVEDDLKSHINNKNIIFVGFTNDVKQYMCSSDVYVSFSSSEGFSISVLEALQTYNYLLLSDIPSHREVLDIDNKTYMGELIRIDKFNQIKNNLCNHLNDKDEKVIVSFLNDNLSIKKMMSLYSNIYNS